MIKIALLGANGRMGQAVKQLAPALDIGITLEVTRETSVEAFLATDFALLLDFAVGDAILDYIPLIHEKKCALVSASTGHGARTQEAIQQLAESVPVVLAPNTSLGVCLLEQVMTEVAQALARLDIKADYNIEDVHHTGKQDMPSGTLLALKKSLSACLSDDQYVHSQVSRVGDVIGEHTLDIGLPLENLSFKHEVHDRAVFARGALVACRWLMDQAPGFYNMKAVLGIN